MSQIYLDYAAATPMDPKVESAMGSYLGDNFYNPSATYLAARAVRADLNEARANVAAHFGCRPAEVVFTAGATEANNLAIAGIMNLWPDGEVLATAVEHESVLAPVKKYPHKLIKVDARGRLDLAHLEELIGPKTVLVSIMHVNNEIGVLQPIADIANLLNKLSKLRTEKGDKRPLYLHTDAAQSPNFFELKVARLGVDLMTINGGKIYGPKQTGALFIKAGVKLSPQVIGGGQEFGVRSGTENVAGIIGLTVALQIAQRKHSSEAKRLSSLRQRFEAGLLELAPEIKINGSKKHRAPHISSVTFPGTDNERLMMELDEAGVMAAIGSACSASSDEPSHVLSAIGLSAVDARSTLRFSLGCPTTEAEIDYAVKTLKSILAQKA